MQYEELIKQINKVTIESNIKIDEPMENYTSFKVGGPADVLVTPENAEEVQSIIKICKENNADYYLVRQWF